MSLNCKTLRSMIPFYFLIPLPLLLMTSMSKICPIPLHPLSLLYFYLILSLPPLIDLDLDPPLCFPFFIFLYAPSFAFQFWVIGLDYIATLYACRIYCC